MTDEHPPTDDATTDVTEQRRSDHGVSITTELKRGSGTREQDKHVIKAKGASFSEAAHYHRQAIEYLTGDRPDDAAIADLARQVQPDADGGDD